MTFFRIRYSAGLMIGVALVLSSSAQNEGFPLAKSFEKLQAMQMALAADDYYTATTLAPSFLEAAKAEITGDRPKLFRAAERLSAAESLQKARENFADVASKFSNATETLPENGGYYTCVCTSVPGSLQFVQREKEITHCPYGGRANPTCGRVMAARR